MNQFLYLCVLYFGSAEVWACNTTFRAPCKALGLDTERFKVFIGCQSVVRAPIGHKYKQST